MEYQGWICAIVPRSYPIHQRMAVTPHTETAGEAERVSGGYIAKPARFATCPSIGGDQEVIWKSRGAMTSIGY